jgi:hypothetical protein
VAVVTLPDSFEALNRDFRYQLSVIGQFAQAVVNYLATPARMRSETCGITASPKLPTKVEADIVL